MKKIILASSSPRRKEILENLGIDFDIITSDIDEVIEGESSPYELVKKLSESKALAVKDKVEPESVIIACDTVVSLLGKVLGKPKDRDDAFDMLKCLQGKKHTVYTGMTLIFKDKSREEMSSYVDSTDVFMRGLTDNEIQSYLDTKEPFDKAGAYAIQGKGSLLIEGVSGDYFTVVGLPVSILQKAFKEHNINIMDDWNK